MFIIPLHSNCLLNNIKVVFRLWNLVKRCKLALKKSHNLSHNSPILSHNLPWKYRTISYFLSHPMRWPVRCLSLVCLNWLSTQHCYNSHINNSASFCGFRQLGWTNFFYSIRLTTLGKPWTSRHALWFDLDQDGQGFLARLTNFWPHQPRPVQANCRPNFSAFPCQALPVLTLASDGLSRPCRSCLFFAFPSQLRPRLTAARPGRADPVAAASPVSLSPGQHGQSPAHPGFQARL